jgi:hypothetical protein
MLMALRLFDTESMVSIDLVTCYQLVKVDIGTLIAQAFTAATGANSVQMALDRLI